MPKITLRMCEKRCDNNCGSPLKKGKEMMSITDETLLALQKKITKLEQQFQSFALDKNASAITSLLQEMLALLCELTRLMAMHSHMQPQLPANNYGQMMQVEQKLMVLKEKALIEK